MEIIRAVRAATKEWKGFAVGVKVNSVDHQEQERDQGAREWVGQLRLIVEAGVDFIEVSGGTYENPTMSTGPAAERSARTAAREAFFLEFAEEVRREFPHVPLIVTGGFRSRRGMEAAVAGGECDMVGLGRPAVLNPLLPKTVVLSSEVRDEDAVLYVRKLTTPWWLRFLGIRAIGAGIESVSLTSALNLRIPKLTVVKDLVYWPDEGTGQDHSAKVRTTCSACRQTVCYKHVIQCKITYIKDRPLQQ